MDDFLPSVFLSMGSFVKYKYTEFLPTYERAEKELEPGATEIPANAVRTATNLYSDFLELCTQYGMRASAATIKKILDLLGKDNPTYTKLYSFGEELSGRFEDELRESRCLIFDTSSASLYDEPTKGWENVVTQFPSAAYDIEEGSRCLALDRSTAAAFHSIRSLEAAIRAISRCLGIPDPTRAAERNWGAVLKTVKDELDWPTSTTRMTGDGEFFDSAYAALAAMQNPWRNATMHLDQIYTPDDARHLNEVIKGFMRKIASRCDESGDPKA